MIPVLLCMLSVAFGTLKNTLSKQLSSYSALPEHISYINLFSMAFAAVGLGIYAAATGNFAYATGYTLRFALFYALLSLLSQILLLLAMGCGSVAFSSLVFSCGFIPSTMLGMWYYSEPVRAGQLIGIVILVFAMYLCLAPKRGEQASCPPKWFAFAFGAFLCSGLVGFLQKYHQNGADKAALPAMLTFVFCINVVCSAGLFFILHIHLQKKRMQSTPPKASYSVPHHKRFYLLCILLGGIFAVQNLNNTYLSGILPSAIFFPILNGSIILCTALCARFLFGERMRCRQWIGFLIGIAAMIAVGIF